MRKTKFVSAIALLAMVFICSISMIGCSSESIVGTWHEGDWEWDYTGADISFYEDGSCVAVPMTNYNTSHYYEVYDDGLLMVSNGSGSTCSYTRVASEYEALHDRNTYYLSGDKLILREIVYIRR